MLFTSSFHGVTYCALPCHRDGRTNPAEWSWNLSTIWVQVKLKSAFFLVERRKVCQSPAFYAPALHPCHWSILHQGVKINLKNPEKLFYRIILEYRFRIPVMSPDYYTQIFDFEIAREKKTTTRNKWTNVNKWSILSQTLDMTPRSVTTHWHRADQLYVPFSSLSALSA